MCGLVGWLAGWLPLLTSLDVSFDTIYHVSMCWGKGCLSVNELQGIREKSSATWLRKQRCHRTFLSLILLSRHYSPSSLPATCFFLCIFFFLASPDWYWKMRLLPTLGLKPMLVLVKSWHVTQAVTDAQFFHIRCVVWSTVFCFKSTRLKICGCACHRHRHRHRSSLKISCSIQPPPSEKYVTCWRNNFWWLLKYILILIRQNLHL